MDKPPHSPPKQQALVHLDRQQWSEAIECLSQALNADFLDEECMMMASGALLAGGKYGMSAVFSRQAIAVRRQKGKHFPEAVSNLAYALRALNKNDSAEETWRMALEIETDQLQIAKILSNIAACRFAADDNIGAIETYNRALAVRPDLATAQFNRSFPNLALGRWQQGWADYDFGFESGDRKQRAYNGVPTWNDEPNKTILVWAEQGIGDEIMFASYLPNLLRVAKKVIFDCHPRLVSLFKRSFPEIEIHGTRKQLNDLRWLDDAKPDFSVCLSRLASMYRNSDIEFPGKPFLKAAQIKRGPGLRIGISWQGGTPATRGDLRTIPLREWLPILKADAEFFSLQYTPSAASEVCELEETTGVRIKHFPGLVQCNNYDQTASFVASLDLVITVPTTVWHLAGALGVPTWLMVPTIPPWACGHGCGLWYGATQTAFRQNKSKPWSAVTKRVGETLADFEKLPRAEQATA